MKKINFPLLILCIAIPLIAGGLSGYFTTGAITGWYTTLQKPSFNPPNYIFGPVWTTLYILMGISLYMVLKSENNNEKKTATIVFFIQLILNFFWSIFFFYLERLDLAILIILGMLTFISYMILLFRKIKPIAGYLQIPYLLWVSFATLLNISIWWLNR